MVHVARRRYCIVGSTVVYFCLWYVWSAFLVAFVFSAEMNSITSYNFRMSALKHANIKEIGQMQWNKNFIRYSVKIKE